MADPLRNAPVERDVEQAVTALKKGAHLLKYGRRGKPKFCPFRLSNDESVLIWYSGKDEKQLKLSHVSKIIPGQRTAIFQRYPRPDKEYQSFSLIYNDRSLDLICKDKDEAEVWFVGLKALISRGFCRKWRSESKGDRTSTDTNSPSAYTRGNSPLNVPFGSTNIFQKDSDDAQQHHIAYESNPVSGFGKVFSEVILYTAPGKSSFHSESICNSLNSFSSGAVENSDARSSTADAVRVSLSSAVSSSSHGSGQEDFDALGDVFIWGEGTGDGVLGGGSHRVGSFASGIDGRLPKALESSVVLDIHSLACGSRHAVLVTKQGEVFSWGEESGGRLGLGVDADVSHPKLIDALSGMSIEQVACGEYHSCAVTLSGDLYTWGDSTYSSGFLGHGSEASHWIPKKVTGQIEGLHVSSVSCGTWHTAVVTSTGQLFTFGDGVFGALGHGDRRCTTIPREVEALKGMRTVRAACGVWHTAAVVEIKDESSDSVCSSGKLFTWGDGDKGRLGHGDREARLVPALVSSLSEPSFCQVACGLDITIALTTTGRVYVMGSTAYGQLGNPKADGKLPTCIGGNICDSFVEEISCGSYHAAVLTSRTEVYTWGKGANGRLGHGDNDDRSTPTLVEALKDKQVKSVVCGSNFTAVICLHKWVSGADQSVCSGCHLQFGFRRKRHNCYNCGLVFCKACSSRKSVKASLAPNVNKPYRVCDECYSKLKKVIGDGVGPRITKHQIGSSVQMSHELAEKETLDSRIHRQISRLSSVESFKAESRQSRQNCKSELKNNQFPSTPNECLWTNIHTPISSNISLGSSRNKYPASTPGSRRGSGSTSPVSSRPSPPHSTTTFRPPEVVVDGSKQANGILSQEVVRLKLQVEELTHKSQLLEAELEKTSRELKEAMSTAEEEAAKSKAAKEVIKSLTVQLKDMAERVPEGYMVGNRNRPATSPASNMLILPSTENDACQTLESNGDSSNLLLCNGTNSLVEEAEWIEQAEAGVYMTISSFPGGGKYLKRVRFSRKKFTEQQAEKWWAENRARLQELYRIPTEENTSSAPATGLRHLPGEMASLTGY